jgi:hypothetical protein
LSNERLSDSTSVVIMNFLIMYLGCVAKRFNLIKYKEKREP